MKVLSVDPASPLCGRVRPGFTLLSVNGESVLDVIDFRYRITGERGSLRFADQHGDRIDLDFGEDTAADLGLTFEEDKIRLCNNDCIFCFIAQQPAGMRPGLYVRDEDYRLSFTHGNYITLSNVTNADMARIVRQRLSPLYVSVHTTDDRLRRRLLQNDTLPAIMPRLRHMTENGVAVHTQIVLCPGVNDGVHLERSIDDLASLYPGVASLAVVPVGLTKYRDGLPQLRACRPAEAVDTIDYIEARQEEFLSGKGSRFVWPADEFYVTADRDFPPRHVYEEMPQFEDGVGMAREFVTVFNRRRSRLKRIRSDRRVLFLTGYSAYPFLSREVMPYVQEKLGLNILLDRVSNRFWGRSVTVSGLLTGRDLLAHARRKADEFDALVLPPNCLNSDGLFLDDLLLGQFASALGKRVLVGQYNLVRTIEEALS